MTSDLTVTVFERAGFYIYDSGLWQDLIEETLRGSMKKTSSGGTTIYSDRYTGLKMTVETSGGAVTSMVIEGPEGGRGSSLTALVEVSFGGDTVGAKAFLKALDATHKTSGQDAALDKFLMSFTYDVTTLSDPITVTDHAGSSVIGGRGDDMFQLSDGYHQVYATTGDDTYAGGMGFDHIGYEMIEGGGIKLVRDGGGRTVEKPGGDVDSLTSFEGISGTEANDNLIKGLGNKASQIYGNGGNDKIGGGGKSDLLMGGSGNDKIVGRGGNDFLVGGAGNDNLNGGGGDDVLIGGDGYGYAYEGEKNVMKGGKGTDLFIIESKYQFSQDPNVAMIRDFKDGQDFIGLIGYQSILSGTNDDLVFGDLSFRNSKQGAVISAGEADIAVLKGVKAADLSRADFVELRGADDGYYLFDDYYDGYFYF